MPHLQAASGKRDRPKKPKEVTMRIYCTRCSVKIREVADDEVKDADLAAVAPSPEEGGIQKRELCASCKEIVEREAT